ncbi:MAG: anibiotic ABC transporter [Rhodococcus sp.]|nr:anibiotic ABC transporter [Rhodococcus sp. (in: high G+C Gram-positive bacteria)]
MSTATLSAPAPTPSAVGRGASPFTGTRRLIRLALRRDRIQIPVWLIALTLLMAFSASSVVGLYPTQGDLHEFAMTTAKSPVALATNGLISGDSVGAVTASQTVMLMSVAAGLMSILMVVRHTRQNEETGRAELVEASVVGRKALLTAALAVAAGTNILLAVLVAGVLAAQGFPIGGSALLGLGVGGVGIVFAGVSAIAAQATEGARTANGIGGGLLGLAFLLRAFGDMSGDVSADGIRVDPGWASWLSPVGWAELTRPYDVNAWWVLGLFVVAAAACGLGAFALTERRDIGAGLFPTKPGPERASHSLPTPLGSAWRIQRGTLLWWGIGIGAVALAYGAIGDQIDDFLGDGEQAGDLMAKLGGGIPDMVDAYFAAIFAMMAIAVAAYAVQALLHMRAEESAGRLEQVLATSVGKPRWVLSHVVIVVAGVFALQILTGVATGLAYGLVAGDVAGRIVDLTVAALVFVPAILVVVAVVMLLFGALPALATGLSWAVLAVCLIAGMLGPLLGLPDAVHDISPFSHIPAVPAADVTAGPLIVLTVIALVLGAVGVAMFRRRDLST